jgi:hypothetical protein
MAKRQARTKRSRRPSARASAAVQGAVPYQPKMSSTDARAAVDTLIGERIPLAAYRPTITPLSKADRESLIEQAIMMLDQVYAHLPLKRSLHANDPIQSLRLLRLRQATLDERAFQSALMEIFLNLRDLHTNYVLPGVYARKYAFLPFRVEEYYEPGRVFVADLPQQRKYVVSWVSPVNTATTLKEGMIVTHWNGSPVDLAVARNGDREAGSNADARRAQGIEALTLRWLGMSLPPDEDWVNLTYTDGTKTYESRLEWQVIDLADRAEVLAGLDESAGAAPDIGLDLKRLLLDQARKLIFDPQAIQVEQEVSAQRDEDVAARPSPPRANTSSFPDVFPRFGEVTTPSGKFGYVRLKSFSPSTQDIRGTVAEFRRILETLPPTGLILDVRGNGGGFVNIGELILQMLTPREIAPEPFHFLATPLTLQIVSEPANFATQWKDTIVQGLESGASFSQGFPLTDPVACNAIGQVYQGPVVLVTDALCYSTTDIFAAGFQDHQIGPIIGCHASTGAGGANVWDYARHLQRLSLPSGNPFVALPGGARMRVAIRRCTRVASRSGIPVEDYGVVSNIRYFMTKTDVVGHNDDLIAAAAAILAPLPRQTLRLVPDVTDPLQKFALTCSNVDRIDVFVNDRPALSRQVSGSETNSPISLPFAATPGGFVGAYGHRNGDLVVSTRLSVGP